MLDSIESDRKLLEDFDARKRQIQHRAVTLSLSRATLVEEVKGS